MDKTVIELFAGVCGFRVGLNNITSIDNEGHAIENGNFEFVWANQWKPSTKTQHAFDCYNLRFPKEFNSNQDISLVDKNGRPTEAMPFKAFEFEELINTPWEESSIREDFVDLKLMLFVFKEIDGTISFDKIIFWNAPNKVVDGPIKKMHEECADMVRNGIAFYYDAKGKLKDRFPKEERNSNGVCHVRPHARVETDHYELPIADKETGITSYTKQSFWFNKDFVEKMIKNN